MSDTPQTTFCQEALSIKESTVICGQGQIPTLENSSVSDGLKRISRNKKPQRRGSHMKIGMVTTRLMSRPTQVQKSMDTQKRINLR
eukprot:9269249-Heterocapsa_arctica.AAC.1